jgi:hypothetical protein
MLLTEVVTEAVDTFVDVVLAEVIVSVEIPPSLLVKSERIMTCVDVAAAASLS